MKILFTLILLVALSFGAWPYYHLYRLDLALGSDDTADLAPLVDLPAIRAAAYRQLDNRMTDATGTPPAGSLLGWMQTGIREMGREALEEGIDLEWVAETLRDETEDPDSGTPRSFLQAVDYAFFDAPNGFLIRLGALDNDPLQVQMTFADWRWRVSGLYE